MSDKEESVNNLSQTIINTSTPHSSILRPPRLIIPNISEINSVNSFNSNTNENSINMATPSRPLSEVRDYLDNIPIYKGEPELLTYFLNEAEKVINYLYDAENLENPVNNFISSRIRAKIQGEAGFFIANNDINSWEDLKKALINAYSDKRDDATLAIQMTRLEQSNESPLQFYTKIQKLLNLQITYVTLNYEGNKNILFNHFRRVALKTLLNGLKEPLGSLMRTKDPENLDVALNLLTNTYSKEVENSKHKSVPFIQKKTQMIPKSNFAPFQNQNNRVNNFNSFGQQKKFSPPVQRNVFPNQNFNPRPAFNQNAFQQQKQITYQPTPMSTSTINTFKPNHYNVEVSNVEDEENEIVEIPEENLENSEINEFTPYNDFLGEMASEIEN